MAFSAIFLQNFLSTKNSAAETTQKFASNPMKQQKNSLTQHLYFAISSTTFSITHSLSPNTSIHFYFIPFQTNLHKHRWCAICTNKSSHFYQNNGYGYMNCIEWVELSESFSQLLSQSDSIWYFFPSSLIQFFIIIFQLIFICTYFSFFFIFRKLGEEGRMKAHFHYLKLENSIYY